MKTFTSLVLFSFLILIARPSHAQNLIAVQNGGSPVFFEQVDDAILNSQDGDTIYIPGGNWNISQPINKRLHLFGVGFNIDSSKVTLPTALVGGITLATGASKGSLTGVRCTSTISFTDSISKYVVERVSSPGISFNDKESSYNVFKESIIGYINFGAKLKYNMYFNNIIEGTLGNYNTQTDDMGDYCTYKNNIFLQRKIWDPYGIGLVYALNNVTNALFENNIFMGDSIPVGWANIYTHETASAVNNTFNNNLFVDNFIPSVDYPGYNNIVKQFANSIFVNEAGKDYHLQTNCTGKNAGRDGTDIGIYGGIYPWKEGSIPSNPHFQSIKIDPKTDASGNLNVKIKVAAQDH